MRVERWRGVALAAVAVVLFSGCDWTMFGYESGGSRSSPDTSISTVNVASLALKFKWTPLVPSGCAVADMSTPAIANGTAYAEFSLTSTSTTYPPVPCIAGGGVAAFNAATGATLWTQFLGTSGSGSSDSFTPAVVNGIVYADPPGGVSALNATTGAVVWTAPGVGGSGLAVDGAIVYAAGYNSVSALNATTGALVWSATPLDSGSAPAVGDGFVYVWGAGPTFPWLEELTALNATTGAVAWTVEASTTEAIPESPAVVNGIVYIPLPFTDTGGNHMDAFNATTGAVVWSATMGPEPTGVAVGPGIVYSSDNFTREVRAFNYTTGASVWSTTTGHGDGSPALANGILYTVGEGGLSALNAANGAILWSTTSLPYSAHAPVVANGFVYSGDKSDGNVYAFGLPISRQISATDPVVGGGRFIGLNWHNSIGNNWVVAVKPS
jgi:outer membrane protein assembly factor BamB